MKQTNTTMITLVEAADHMLSHAVRRSTFKIKPQKKHTLNPSTHDISGTLERLSLSGWEENVRLPRSSLPKKKRLTLRTEPPLRWREAHLRAFPSAKIDL